MIYWIRRIARIIALVGFFVIFFSGINLEDPFNTFIGAIAFVKAFCGGVLLWFAGFVISDIILKGAVEDIASDDLEPLEGGLLQRIHGTQNKKRVLDSSEPAGMNKEETKEKDKS